MAIQTRQFEGGVLIPLLDLFNHSLPEKNGIWYFNDESKTVKLQAAKRIAKGDEIFVSYGMRTSQELF
jgi:SET domain-containing protein